MNNLSDLLKTVRYSRDCFRTLVDSSPFGMALTDTSGKIIVGNYALSKFLGVSVKSLVGLNLCKYLDLPHNIFDVLYQDLNVSFCYYRSNILKKTLPNVYEISIFFQPDVGCYWHIRDIKELVKLKKHYKELVESLPVGVFRATRSGVILYLNFAGKKILGVKKLPASFPELIGTDNWQQLVHFFLERDNNHFLTLRDKSEILSQCIKVSADKYFSFSLSSFREPEPSEDQDVILGIFEDVSKERKLQDELNRALWEAEAANRAKTLFLAKMSHELRTPLNTILGMTYLLEPLVANNPKAIEFLNDIRNSAEHLTSLIGNILDFSKIENGKIELVEKDFDLHALSQEVYNAFKEIVAERGLALSLEVDPEVPRWVRADPVRLRQILYNLINNSLKFTEKGGIYVQVRYKKRLQRSHCVQIEVRDTGCGIPPDKIDKVLRPFEQTEEGRQAGGTGLGLAIVKELAQLMNGDVSIQSEPGVGTNFIVELVLKEGRPQEGPSFQAKPLRARKALIVDDVPLNRKVLRNFLERQDWHVKEASHGEEALALLARESFDIVFLDLSMPVMDGWQTIKRLKSDNRFKNVPVVALTAHALVGEKERCLKAGFDAYLSKPIRLEALWQEVTRLIGSKEQKDARKETEKRSEKTGKKPGVDIDWQELVNTCQGSEELAKELLLDLVREGEQWVKEAEEAVKAKDPQRIRRVCHMIRGSASTVSAKRFQAAAEELGRLAREGLLEDTTKALEELKQAYLALREAVPALRRA